MKRFVLVTALAAALMTPVTAATIVVFDPGLMPTPNYTSFSITGSFPGTVHPGGEWLTLYGSALNVTFASTDPLVAWGAYFDTAIAGYGTGVRILADGVLVYDSGCCGIPFATYLGFMSDTAFTQVRLETQSAGGWQGENVTVIDPAGTRLLTTVVTSAVPEPSTFLLVGFGLLGLMLVNVAWWKGWAHRLFLGDRRR